MKKTAAGIVVFSILVGTSAIPAFAEEQVKVFVNDHQVIFQGQQPVIEDGYTFIPVRGTLEAMGVSVVWQEETSSVVLTKDEKTAMLTIGSKELTADGKTQELSAAPKLIGGSTMLPLRSVAEYFDGTVVWNGDERSVSITTTDSTDQAVTTVTYRMDLENEDKTKVLIKGTATYPQLAGDSEAIKLINEKIESASKTAVANYLSANESSVKAEAESLGDDFLTHEYSFTYENTYISDKLFSCCSNEYFFTGGNHGNTIVDGHNFDLATGEEIALDKLFTLGDGVTEQAYLKNLIRDEINKAPENYFEDALTTLADDAVKADFYFNSDGDLVVTLTEAMVVAPYSSGITKTVMEVV